MYRCVRETACFGNVSEAVSLFIFFPSVQTSLDYIFKAVVLKNNEAIEGMFRDCIDKAIGELITS